MNIIDTNFLILYSKNEGVLFREVPPLGVINVLFRGAGDQF